MVGEPPLVFLDEPSCGMDPIARHFMWEVIQSIASRGQHSLVVLTTHSMEEAEALSTRIGIMRKGKFLCLGSGQHIRDRYGGGIELLCKVEAASSGQIGEQLQAWRVEENQKLTWEAVLGMCGASPQAAALATSPIAAQCANVGSVPAKVLVEWWLEEELMHNLSRTIIEAFPAESEASTVKLIERNGRNAHYQLPKEAAPMMSEVFSRLEACSVSARLADYGVSQTTLEQIFNTFAQQAPS